MDGHACMLRFLCEAASAPLHSDGLAGQLVNGLLLTPKYLIDAIIAQGEDSTCITYFGALKGLFEYEVNMYSAEQEVNSIAQPKMQPSWILSRILSCIFVVLTSRLDYQWAIQLKTWLHFKLYKKFRNMKFRHSQNLVENSVAFSVAQLN